MAVTFESMFDKADDFEEWGIPIEDNTLSVQLIILEEYRAEYSDDPSWNRDHLTVCQQIAAGC
jgi:hypothetical protein